MQLKFIYKTILLLTLSVYSTVVVSAQNDTVLHVQMRPVEITSELEWENDTIQYHYNQMKYYVKTILPYLDQAVALFNEMEERVNDPNMSKKEQKAYIRSKQDDLKEKFEDEIKDLNETQGVLLIKLVSRQTGANIYHIIKDYKSRTAAIKWQSWSVLHGFNLNKKYHPSEEPWLERIMKGYGYPLPEFYNEHQILSAK